VKKILLIALAISVAVIFNNCTPSPIPAAACNTANTNFMALYNSLAADTNKIDEISNDFLNHEYTFKSSVVGSICSFGYQNNSGGGVTASNPNMQYQIQLRDANGVVLYSGAHTFATNQSSYVSIAPIAIAANQQYTIRRTVTATGNVYDPVGRVFHKKADIYHYPPPFFLPVLLFQRPQLVFPITFGSLTIVNTKSFDNGNPGNTSTSTNNFLPCIDFVLQ
jgi:hypothetical protein